MIERLPLVIFSHQEQCFGIEASFVRGQGRTDFLAHKTQCLPLECFLSSRTTHLKQEQTCVKAAPWLSLAADSFRLSVVSNPAWVLVIQGDAELVELPAEQIHPLPPLLKARLTFPALQAVAWYQQRLVSLLDARVLLKQAPQLLITLTPDTNQVE